MPKDTPSMARNKIRRSLQAILDPHPTAQDTQKIWDYFDGCCAYCGVSIQRNSRTGHMDHVVSSALGGSNSLNNYVLSCAHCNGDEKREENWAVFLAKKAESKTVEAIRRERIEQWLSNGSLRLLESAKAAEVEAIITEALVHYDAAVIKIRALR